MYTQNKIHVVTVH